MTQIGPYPLVVVEWADSAQPISHWQWLDEYEANGPILCTSVGYIVHDADGVMSLAPNLGDVMRDRAMASGIMRIAQCSIRGVRELAIGAEHERPGMGVLRPGTKAWAMAHIKAARLANMQKKKRTRKDRVCPRRKGGNKP